MDDPFLRDIYRQLFRIRHVELHIADIYKTDVIKSPVHLSIGQESLAVGACAALQPEDYVAATYRCHAAYLAKGGDLNRMMAELYGKSTGCAGGKAGSMHLIDIENGILGASAVVGTTIPVAAGYALALKNQVTQGKTPRVVLSFFGDGATEEGCFYETLNFAALHQLPLIFLCENNGLAIHSPLSKRWSSFDLCARVASFGIATHRITSGDVLEIFNVVNAHVQKIKQGQCEPLFLECLTYRWYEHVGPHDDHQEAYRTQSEFDAWREKDAVQQLAHRIPATERLRIEKSVTEEIQRAVQFAQDSPFPKPAALYTHVFAPRHQPAHIPTTATHARTVLSYRNAIRAGITQVMEQDPSVFLYGLDVDDHRGIQGSTLDLQNTFGSARVFSTPLSEDAMTGVGIGAAMAGMRPIHVHIRMDFLLLCMNQLVNMAAKAHYMYDGQIKVPLVIRAMIGRSWGQGAQHAQALHALFAHIPGLKVVAPANAYDAKGLLVSAIRDNNPVIVVEHRLLYDMESYVPDALYEVPIGQARILSEGEDITIVAVSHMCLEAMRAQKQLAQENLSAEVIDLRSIIPLDIDTLCQSVQKTKRLLIVDNAWTSCGISAEIMAQVIEHVDMPIQMARLGFAPVTCPTTRCLEDLFYPDANRIFARAYELIRGKKRTVNIPPCDVVDAFRGPF